MASIQLVDDFQQYQGFIVKVIMKETKEQQIGWIGMLRSVRPGTSQFADKFPLATLTLVDDWENYSIETDNEMREVSIDATDVESIEILKRVH